MLLVHPALSCSQPHGFFVTEFTAQHGATLIEGLGRLNKKRIGSTVARGIRECWQVPKVARENSNDGVQDELYPCLERCPNGDGPSHQCRSF